MKITFIKKVETNMKYTVWFMRETNGTPLKVASKSVKETDLSVQYRLGSGAEDLKTFTISMKNGVQISKNEVVIMVNIDKEEQYSLHKVEQLMKASDFDLLITQKVIAQIMAKIRNATEPFDKGKLGIYIIVGMLGLVAGVMIGVIAYPAIFPMPTQTVIIQPTPTPNIFIP